MILVVGACASGKRSYAKSCGFAEADLCDARELLDKARTGLENGAVGAGDAGGVAGAGGIEDVGGSGDAKGAKDAESVESITGAKSIADTGDSCDFSDSCNSTLSEAFLQSLAVDGRPVVFNLQAVAAYASPERFSEVLQAKAMVLCNEVGSGVVPIDAGQRAAREATGRLSASLAAQAEQVVRMVCGIPQVLKGASESCPSQSESGACDARLEQGSFAALPKEA